MRLIDVPLVIVRAAPRSMPVLELQLASVEQQLTRASTSLTAIGRAGTSCTKSHRRDIPHARPWNISSIRSINALLLQGSASTLVLMARLATRIVYLAATATGKIPPHASLHPLLLSLSPCTFEYHIY
jgi:hypothetical protein